MTHKNEITLTEEQITELGWSLYHVSKDGHMLFELKSNTNVIMECHFNEGRIEIIVNPELEDYPYLYPFNGYIANIDELKFLMRLLRLK